MNNPSGDARHCMCLCLCLCLLAAGAGVMWGVIESSALRHQGDLNQFNDSLWFIMERQEEELFKLGCQTTPVKIALDMVLVTQGVLEAVGRVYPPWGFVQRCLDITTYCPSSVSSDGGPLGDHRSPTGQQVKRCQAAPGTERLKVFLVAVEHSSNVRDFYQVTLPEHTSCQCQ